MVEPASDRFYKDVIMFKLHSAQQVLRAKCSNMTSTEIESRGNTRVLGFNFLGFLGDEFGVKSRVGVWVMVLSPSFVSHHQFLQPI